MSTRCQIGYYAKLPTSVKAKPSILLYRHNDGDPASVLPALAEFLDHFRRVRGVDDGEYLMAQVLRFLMVRAYQHSVKWTTDFYRDRPDKLPEALAELENRVTGYGICGDRQLHEDIDYLYCISPKGVQVFRLDQDEGLLTADEAAEVLLGKVPTWVTE